MNASCPICFDLFDDCNNVATPCGHIFHSTCLLKWMEGSSDCPECRNRITRDNIIKLFFNTTHSPSLQNDLDSKIAELKSKDSELATVRERVISLEEHACNTEVLYQTLHQKYLATQSELFSCKLELKTVKEDASSIQQKYHTAFKNLFASESELGTCRLELTNTKKMKRDLLKRNLSLESNMKEVQENASTIEQRNQTIFKKHLATQLEIDTLKLQLKKMDKLENEIKDLVAENMNLKSQGTQFSYIHTVLEGTQREAEEILCQQGILLAQEVGSHIAKNMASLCLVLKRKLFQLSSEKKKYQNKKNELVSVLEQRDNKINRLLRSQADLKKRVRMAYAAPRPGVIPT